MKVFTNPKIIACAVALAASVASTALSAAVVVNGDFETLDTITGLQNTNTLDKLQSGPGSSWDVFSSIPGWSTDSGAGIEVQTTRTGIIAPNSYGHHYIELDSHGSNSNSNIYQDIAFSTGDYQLSFWYSPRVNGDGDTNNIEYSIGDANGTVSGPSAGTPLGAWTQITDTFTVASDTTLRLSFQASGLEESLGGFVDNISITAVPLPAAAWLFGSALFGLVTMARRRKATA